MTVCFILNIVDLLPLHLNILYMMRKRGYKGDSMVRKSANRALNMVLIMLSKFAQNSTIYIEDAIST